MNKKILLLGIIYACCGIASSAIINGDAESGDCTGWDLSGDEIISAVQFANQSTGRVNPAQGDYLFSFVKTRGSYAMMSQSGLINPGTESLTLGGLFQGEYADYGVATLNIYDQSGTELLSHDSGILTSPYLVWSTFQFTSQLPQNSHSWQVTLEGFLYYGSYVNVFYDDVYLVPEPATLCLFGLGGLVLRRKRKY